MTTCVVTHIQRASPAAEAATDLRFYAPASFSLLSISYATIDHGRAQKRVQHAVMKKIPTVLDTWRRCNGAMFSNYYQHSFDTPIRS